MKTGIALKRILISIKKRALQNAFLLFQAAWKIDTFLFFGYNYKDFYYGKNGKKCG